MKKAIFIGLISIGLSYNKTYAGGVPTIDSIANGQLQQTVINLTDQLENMKKHLKAIQGISSMANIMAKAGVKIHKLYPELASDLQNIDNLLSKTSALKKEVDNIQSDLQALTSKDLFDDRLSSGRFWYEEKSKHIFTNMAINKQAMTVTTERKKVFESLRKNIESAKDPKDKQDLLLNINLELLQVMNDLVHTIQVQQQMRLNDQNVEHNNWARTRQIQTKMSDVRLSDPKN